MLSLCICLSLPLWHTHMVSRAWLFFSSCRLLLPPPPPPIILSLLCPPLPLIFILSPLHSLSNSMTLIFWYGSNKLLLKLKDSTFFISWNLLPFLPSFFPLILLHPIQRFCCINNKTTFLLPGFLHQWLPPCLPRWLGYEVLFEFGKNSLFTTHLTPELRFVNSNFKWKPQNATAPSLFIFLILRRSLTLLLLLEPQSRPMIKLMLFLMAYRRSMTHLSLSSLIRTVLKMLKPLFWCKRNFLRSIDLLSALLFNPMLTTLTGLLHLHRSLLLAQTILAVVVVLQDLINIITGNPSSRITTPVLGSLLRHLHLRSNLFSVNSVSNLVTLLYIAGQGHTYIYLLIFLLMFLFIILPLSMTMLLNQVVFKLWKIQTLWRMLKAWLCLLLLTCLS